MREHRTENDELLPGHHVGDDCDFEDFDAVDWTDPEVRAQLWADSQVLQEAIRSGLLDADVAAEIQLGLR